MHYLTNKHSFSHLFSIISLFFSFFLCNFTFFSSLHYKFTRFAKILFLISPQSPGVPRVWFSSTPQPPPRPSHPFSRPGGCCVRRTIVHCPRTPRDAHFGPSSRASFPCWSAQTARPGDSTSLPCGTLYRYAVYIALFV